MAFPMRPADLVLDELVARAGVRNAQQRLGETHQHDTLFAGELILIQKSVETAGADVAGAHRGDQVLRQGLDPARQILRQSGLIQAGRDAALLIHSVRGRNRGAQRIGLRERRSEQHESTLYGSRFETSPQAGSTVRGFIRLPERPCAA